MGSNEPFLFSAGAFVSPSVLVNEYDAGRLRERAGLRQASPNSAHVRLPQAGAPLWFRRRRSLAAPLCSAQAGLHGGPLTLLRSFSVDFCGVERLGHRRYRR